MMLARLDLSSWTLGLDSSSAASMDMIGSSTSYATSIRLQAASAVSSSSAATAATGSPT